jgi:hypothetical protein
MANAVIDSFGNITVDWEDPVLCSPSYFTIQVYKNDILFSSINVNAQDRSWFFSFSVIGFGKFYFEILAYLQEFGAPTPTLCEVQTTNTLINGVEDCIPINVNNLSFSTLSKFYSLGIKDDLELSGPNNPSTGNTIFGKSPLPLSGGTANKTRPNAVSELRGSCVFTPNPIFNYSVEFVYESNFIDPTNTAYQGGYLQTTYNLVWFSNYLGTTKICPSNGYIVTLKLTCQNFNISGVVNNTIPYELNLIKNSTNVGSVSRVANNNGTVTNTFIISLNQGDILNLRSLVQLNPFSNNCGRTMTYLAKVEFVEAFLNSNYINSVNGVTEQFILNSSACNLNTELTYVFKKRDNINGSLRLYINNVLTDTLTTSTTKKRFVPSDLSVRIETTYSGNSLPLNSENPRIKNTVVSNNNTPVETNLNLTNQIGNTLQSTFTTLSTGTNKLLMEGNLTFDSIANCGSSLYGIYQRNLINYITDIKLFLGTATGSFIVSIQPILVGSIGRFQIIFNNNILVDTGYITSSTTGANQNLSILNQKLTALGEPTVPFITVLPWDNGAGAMFVTKLNKPTASPNNVILRVFFPFGSDWVDENLILFGYGITCPK